MPHYKDGTEAKPGDVVRGKGYNVKDADENLATIVAIVLSVTPGVEQCNVRLLIPTGTLGTLIGSNAEGSGSVITGTFEYGQADHFEKVTA